MKTMHALMTPLKNWIMALYEKYMGIDTPKEPKGRVFFEYARNMRGYEPSNWLTLKRIDKIIHITPMDTLIDFGSGKGKMVYLAARYPLKKVIGVEISRHLHDIAKKNIAHNQKRFKCKNIRLVNADVLDFAIPDDLTIAYFFNPFLNEIFIQVISNIEASLKKNPRKIWVVYKNPQMKAYLDNCSWLTFVKIDHNIAFYRSNRD